MVLFRHEMKQSRKVLLIWSAAVAFLIVICMLMFPEMKEEMDTVTDMFSNMGDFSAAFGMDQLSMGTLMGFYGIECGTILAIAGSFLAAFLGIQILAREEGGHTAEFLLVHPLRRAQVVAVKYAALVAQLLIFNLICILCAMGSAALVGEELQIKEFLLFHLAQLVLQWEIASICFGLSARLSRSAVGAGLGLAALLYFCNIFVNLSEKAEFLKYVTPFQYADAAQIINHASIEAPELLAGACYGIIGLGAAFFIYLKKDIRA